MAQKKTLKNSGVLNKFIKKGVYEKKVFTSS